MTDAAQPVRSCDECGGPLSGENLHGLCARCLVAQSLSSASAREEGISVADLAPLFTDFEVRDTLGRGGMGTVYRAWQKSVEREVALKVLPPELLGDEEFRVRFEREARVMAQLDHPNVAKVFGAGISVIGDPYFVMEYIEGQPITQYAARRSLTVRERLELFLQVCRGVEHAHQKGLIHHDLKPANILVAEPTGQPVVKLIDFGLAKPLHAEARSAAEGDYPVAGTPAYMSPEQAAGQPVDTRSDIYALGALLYELLAGSPPLDDRRLQNASPTVIERAVRESPTPRPSDRVSTSPAGASLGLGVESGAKSLTGDLDAIALKALARKPAERYQAVAELAQDIERHFRHQPVSAMPQTRRYVLSKFVQRNRFQLAVAALAALVALAGVLLILFEATRARHAEALAAGRLRQGERLIEFMLGDLYRQLQPVGRLDVLSNTVFETRRFYDGGGAGSSSLESRRQQAHAHQLLGEILEEQGQLSGATTELLAAVGAYRSLMSRAPEKLDWRNELAAALNDLGIAYIRRGDATNAQSAFRECLDLRRGIAKAAPSDAQWQAALAAVAHNLARLELDLEKPAAAAPFLSEAGAAIGRWQRLRPQDQLAQERLLVVRGTEGALHEEQGDFAGAEKVYHEKAELARHLVEQDARNSPIRFQWSGALESIARLQHQATNDEAATESIAQGISVLEPLVAQDPTNREWRWNLAGKWRLQGQCQAALGRPPDALASYRRAIELCAQEPALTTGIPEWFEIWKGAVAEAGAVLDRLAAGDTAAGDSTSARQREQEALRFREQLGRAPAAK